MKDYNSITFKNRAIDRLTVETTKPDRPLKAPEKRPGQSEQERRDTDLKKVSELQKQKKEAQRMETVSNLLARRKEL
jgi:hypothetical protein